MSDDSIPTPLTDAVVEKCGTFDSLDFVAIAEVSRKLEKALTIEKELRADAEVTTIKTRQYSDLAHRERDEARRDAWAALDLVSRIRFALGDDGKRMQDELIAYCAELRELADRYRDLSD